VSIGSVIKVFFAVVICWRTDYLTSNYMRRSCLFVYLTALT
jgi:hypothetical protein